MQGIVSRVTDGDSLWLARPGKPPLEVRLRDIDAPELCQPWGAEAKQALSDLALDKVASLRISGHDGYGRTVGALLLDELDVGRFLVENGHAWSIRSRWDQGPLVKQEKMALALRRGLHATGGALQPKEFRRAHGACGVGQSVAQAVAEPARSAPVAAAAPAAPVPATTATATASVTYRCDGRTHCSQMRSCDEAKFFLAHCPGVKMDGGARNGVPCEKQWCGR